MIDTRFRTCRAPILILALINRRSVLTELFSKIASSLLISIMFLAGCAATGANTLVEVQPRHTISEFKDQRFAEVSDPWEGFNRSIYRFNYNFDKYLFLPVVSGYQFVTPTFVQDRISSFYNNLGEVQNFSNSLFQLKGIESVKTLGRFVTNSTVGLGGMFDPATKFGLACHPEDFGKTLGHWGVDSGPYLVLPIFGPSSVRDAGGLAVDSGITYGIYTVTDPFGSTGYSLELAAGVSTLEAVDTRKQQSFRYYESGYPFEYNMVRFFYHEKRKIESSPQLLEE